MAEAINCRLLPAHSVRTFKPVRFDPVEHKLLTSDKNNDKKFAFITQETVVDYRSVEVTKLCQHYFMSVVLFTPLRPSLLPPFPPSSLPPFLPPPFIKFSS